ncbi:aminotransferase class I/II-fold pyridoxal phosphate-dependent enzyme [Streptomyces sp. NPDC091416]|uniref:aminotransferase class I/II-fold pyridoxal phosphate-dependent enzyme n=1 Tax=Streptomyces sp. NPDC091416 TaxID=3366003 RepID=UPI00380C32FC
MEAADTQQLRFRDPSMVQGGDLTHLTSDKGMLNLSLCTNRIGPPPGAVDAVRRFLDHHAARLMPPPYEAEQPPFQAHRLYLNAFADRLGIDHQDMLAGRGVTEFLMILGRRLQLSQVAVITPEYTETLRRFGYAHFEQPEDPFGDTPARRLARVQRAMHTYDFVILSNPSNPLGHYIERQDLLEACARFPHCTLIVDEEYIEFQGRHETLAGADATNLIVLQSTGKTYGITGSRAGMLWTRNTRIRHVVADELPAWPLSLLDIALATAALAEEPWLERTLTQLKMAGEELEQLLTQHFGSATVPSDIHYRFVHLSNPYPAHHHLQDHGIAARLFTAARGCSSGLRISTPGTPNEFDQLRLALETLPSAARPGHRYPPYAGKSVLHPHPQLSETANSQPPGTVQADRPLRGLAAEEHPPQAQDAANLPTLT